MKPADYVGSTTAQHRGCWHLVRVIYCELLDIFLPSYSDGAEQVLIDQHKGEWLKVLVPNEYDLVLFRMAGKPHIGVMCSERRFIHAISGRTASVESLDSFRWRTRIEGFYRFAR